MHTFKDKREKRQNASRMSIAGIFIMALSLLPSQAFAATSACTDSDIALRLTCQFGSLIDLSVVIAYFMGSVMFVIGGFLFYTTSKNPNESKFKPWLAMFVGTLLLGFTEVVTLYQDALFGSGDVYQVSQYNDSLSRISGVDGAAGSASTNIVKALFGFSKLVGVIAIIRSIILIWDRSGHRRGQSTVGQIISFALGGVIAFRAEDFACMIGNMFDMTSICFI